MQRDAQPFQDKGPKKEKEKCRGPKQHVNIKACYTHGNFSFVVTHMNYIYYFILLMYRLSNK